MDKGVILLLDDDQNNLDTFSHLYEQCDINLKLMTFKDIEKFRSAIKDESIKPNIKAVIFDLVQKQSEETGTEFEVSKDIKDIFDSNRIPIFIHSAYIHKYLEFEDKGTVFKISKSATSTQSILDKIKLFHDSGFFDIFRPGGIIEREIMTELHNAFIKQFCKNEIEDIIETIKEADSKKYGERVINVFKRISIRALMSKLIAPEVNSEGELDVTVNAVEHYLRRISPFEIWTGDIFVKKDDGEIILVLTPRCDIASKNIEHILTCNIIPEFPPNNKKDKIKRALTDNADLSGNKYRYLPPTPSFKGGKVDLSSPKTVTKTDLLNGYNYLITLSDELINEISGKFSAYFMRTGITNINIQELLTYLEKSCTPDSK